MTGEGVKEDGAANGKVEENGVSVEMAKSRNGGEGRAYGL